MRANYRIYLNKEFQELIKNEYLVKYKTIAEISDEFKYSKQLIGKTIKFLGINKSNQNPGRRRKFKVNDDFFNKINSEQSAYFLGLLYADGNVSSSDNRILIRLQERDKEILDKLNELIYLDRDRPLLYERRKDKNPTFSNTYCFSVQSSVMKRDLIKLGCHPNKKQTLRFPTFDQVPREYMRHFLRGFFDGDGNIYYTISEGKYLRPILRFFSNETLSNQIYEFLNCELSLKASIFSDPRTLSWTCRTTGQKNISMFYTYFYNGASLFLERKKEKFEEIFANKFFNPTLLP